jgi:hypothetical protein
VKPTGDRESVAFEALHISAVEVEPCPIQPLDGRLEMAAVRPLVIVVEKGDVSRSRQTNAAIAGEAGATACISRPERL